ncbi:hypothetical protein X742_20295 [Mesorhizobium sp. LNHC232B00]|nr:hypothetical protein X742_20295 [Mesorhizobium sp. LNHC232B00]
MTAAAVASGRRRLDHAFARQVLGKWLARPQPMTAAAVASGRRRLDHAFARQVLGKWLARRSLAHVRRHLGGPGRCLFGGDLVFRRRALEFLEGEFHLVVQAG